MFVRETICTFQLDNQYIFDEQIGKVLPYRLALVGYCEWSFGSGPDATQSEFCQ